MSSFDTENRDVGLSYFAERLALLQAVYPACPSLDREAHQKAFADLCKDPSLERKLLEEIQSQTCEEARKILGQEKINCDCLVVGTGPAGVSLATRIRELFPEVNLLMVDEREYRGGNLQMKGIIIS